MNEGAPGHIVGDRYLLIRELGRGGMGVVYLGHDLRLDMEVALKFRGVSQSDATVWLKREFRTVASLRHPNLVELYELVAHDRTCYFTMEYLPGIDPRRWVESPEPPRPSIGAMEESTQTVLPRPRPPTETSGPGSAPPPPAPRDIPDVDFNRVRSVIAQLAEGLAYLHAHGVIHRDIKPSNTMVLDGAVKLLDFGLALERQRLEADLARESRVVGTAAYLAPESHQRLAVSPAMDVYALGVLGFELMTGTPPYGGALHVLARMQKKIVVPRATSLNRAVPRDLDDLIDAMLATEPGQRPSALDVAVILSGGGSQPIQVRERVRREPRFVGRTAELEHLAARIADPVSRGRLVVVTGAPGAGKTALIERAIRREAAALIWRGRCHERERVPYRAFDLIVDDLATELASDPGHADDIMHIAALGRVFPQIASVLDPRLDSPAASDRRVERERALIALTQLFARLLDAPRGVIVIDDLQWADDDSLELLALLVERTTRPLTVLASWATDEAEPPALAALRDRLGDAAERLELSAMSEADLAQLISELAPRAPADRIVAAARLAAGSPYIAELIGRELGEAGVADARDAEVRRLDRLDADERDVAEVIAIARGTCTFEQLRSVARLPSSRLSSVLRGLEDARIVRALPSVTGDPVYAFYHAQLRETAVAGIDVPHRRTLHERYARWYDDGSRDPGQLAYHYQQAGQLARAADWAIAAGDAAQSQLAWSVAADWYAKAITLGADADRVRPQLAEMLFLGGKLAQAADEFLALARTSGDAWRVRAAEAYLKLGELDRGLGVLDDVLERRGERRTRSRTLSIVRAAGVAARWLAPLPARSVPHDDVLAAAYRVIASFLSTPYPIESFEYVLRGVALADRGGDRAAFSQGMAMLSAYLATGSLGRFGDRALRTAHRLSAHSGAPYPRMVAAGASGILATLRGDWPAMRTAHEEGERICRRLGLERSWEASFLRSYWALGELYAGEPRRALGLLDELRDASDDHFGRAMIGSYRGRALVVAGDLAEARALAAALDRTPAARQGMASIYRQVFLAELALAEHAWAEAREIAAELAASARQQWLLAMPAISAMVDVIVATAALGLGAAQVTRETARRLYRRGRSSFYAATALRLWAQAEGALGQAAAHRRLLARARSVAAERGGKVDRLAIAALAGEPIDAGPLAAAVSWATAGRLGGTRWPP